MTPRPARRPAGRPLPAPAHIGREAAESTLDPGVVRAAIARRRSA
ncbi:hypothetical protein [Micromonospora sp. DPT]